MPKVQVAASSFTLKSSNVDWQGFGYLYRDRRGEAAVVDNTFSLDRPVDVTIGDDWRLLRARVADGEPASSISSPGSRRRPATGMAARIAPPASRSKRGIAGRASPYRPWLRAGYLWASGDRNGDDDRHGTFFQMLPSSRKYALSSVYAQMNLSDAFAQLAIEPRGLRARIEVHALHLASGADLWYQGSGATASKGRFFGFSGRSARGDTALGTVARRRGRRSDQEILVDQRLRRRHVRRPRRHQLVHRQASHVLVRRERPSFLT